MRKILLPAALAALSACAQKPQAMVAMPVVQAPAEPVTGWKAIVSGEDDQRLSNLPDLWRSALTAAQRYRSQIRSEGDLLAPDAARNHPAPPPGSYHCRLVKIGAAGAREPAYKAFPEFFCYIRGDRADSLFFTKQTGSELPGGFLFADGERRLVLAGAKQHAATEVPMPYGTEPERDLVGVVERIGPFRWRVVLPWRGQTQGLDIYELIPVPPEQQAAEPPADDRPAGTGVLPAGE
jgi:hypothetical protein